MEAAAALGLAAGLEGRKLCTVKEAASFLAVTERSAYDWAKTGKLPALKIGGRVYIKVPQLLAMIDGA